MVKINYESKQVSAIRQDRPEDGLWTGSKRCHSDKNVNRSAKNMANKQILENYDKFLYKSVYNIHMVITV